MNNELAALRLFTRVAHTGSFSRAAREISITQSSASRIIAQLEEQLGASLFTRTTRALALTEAGADYLERVERILADLDEAGQSVRGSGELRGTLRVGVSSTLVSRVVIPGLPAFMAAHPDLRIELLIDDKRQDLVFDGVDIAIRFGAMPDSTAVARLLATWPRVVAAAPSYLERFPPVTDPAGLTRYRAINGYAGLGPGWTFRRGAEEASVRVETALTVTSNEAAIAAAVAGLGVFVTTRFACSEQVGNGLLVRLLPDWELEPLPMHAVFASGRAAKPSARAFADFLAQALAEL